MNEFGALQDSRRILEGMERNLICQIRGNPGDFERLYPRWGRLMQRQIALENALRIQQGANFSGIFIPIIIGGMSLLGIGGWIWKHRTDVEGEERYLDCLNRMIDEGGMVPQEAAMVCKSESPGVVSQLSDLTRNALILTFVAGGLFLIIKMKK